MKSKVKPTPAQVRDAQRLRRARKIARDAQRKEARK